MAIAQPTPASPCRARKSLLRAAGLTAVTPFQPPKPACLTGRSGICPGPVCGR